MAYTFTAKTQTVEMLEMRPHESFYKGLTQYPDARPGPG